MPRPPLHVAQVSFFLDPQGRPPAQLLEAWTTLVDVAEAAAAAGLRVSVVQACREEARISRQGVDYHFGPLMGVNGAGGPFQALLRSLAPDVIHVHGLESVRQLPGLACLASTVPIVVQDHASRVPRPWRRPAWRAGLARANALAFCAAEQARPFAAAGLVPPDARIYAVPESTSRFTPGDRAQARRAADLPGEPGLLWVGHLDANKDPLTVLAGVAAATRELPGLQLTCCFGSAPLLRQVRARIARDPRLRGRVHLRGRVPHAAVEELMQAADLFVLGSHREGSGYSVIESLACGLPPVVTDIASFRALTAGGAVGRLWRCDEPDALCEALRLAARDAGSAQRLAVRAHFERELSFTALGAKLAAMYRELLRATPRAAALRAG